MVNPGRPFGEEEGAEGAADVQCSDHKVCLIEASPADAISRVCTSRSRIEGLGEKLPETERAEARRSPVIEHVVRSEVLRSKELPNATDHHWPCGPESQSGETDTGVERNRLGRELI